MMFRLLCGESLIRRHAETLLHQKYGQCHQQLDWFDYRLLFSGGSTPLLPADIKRRGELRTELVLQGLSYYAAAQS